MVRLEDRDLPQRLEASAFSILLMYLLSGVVAFCIVFAAKFWRFESARSPPCPRDPEGVPPRRAVHAVGGRPVVDPRRLSES